jgi:phosphatidylinositol 4-kinase
MEAKLASLQSRKPADEDYVPGQGIDSKFNAPRRDFSASASASVAREGSASASPGPGSARELDLDEEMGLDAATKAADELEREFGLEIAGHTELGDVPSRPGSEGGRTPTRGSPVPVQVTKEVDEKEKRKLEVFKQGLAALPKKPSFL